MIYTSERLFLRKYSLEDVPLLHAITSDRETMSFYPNPFSLEQTTAWINRSIKSYEDHGFGRYAVFLKEGEEFIGCAGFFRTEVNGTLENDLGYIIGKQYWNHGYATEAAQACIQLAKENKWFTRIAIQMAEDHTRSRLVAERLGATLEKIFVNPKNRNYPTCLYALLLE